jgi:U4/U6.U5 tri-snRNP-associated protein 2
VLLLLLFRDFFLMPANYAGCRSLLVARFGELIRKLWNRQNFKGQVSPHEFMQASRRIQLVTCNM